MREVGDPRGDQPERESKKEELWKEGNVIAITSQLEDITVLLNSDSTQLQSINTLNKIKVAIHVLVMKLSTSIPGFRHVCAHVFLERDKCLGSHAK
jgi:hypothetical protein